MTEQRQDREAGGARERGGLRERKKTRTRERLLRTALELFAARGYESTTVDEIAARAEVSTRTFFRYFATKEHVALATQELIERWFLQALRARPAGEPPVLALRRAVLESWGGLPEVAGLSVPVDLHLRTCRLVARTPALLAARLRRASESEEEMARVIAAREGVDPERDLRPRVVVAAFGGVMRLTEHRWGAGQDGSVEALRALAVQHLDHLTPALVREWGEEGADADGVRGAGTEPGDRTGLVPRQSATADPATGARPADEEGAVLS
ncbi:TetR/AcrR family transcriptional regulator [Streptomyces sp. NPDC088923]|uniref:TetR/AcrR family transcriptional regulator n=1 Tax=Streptomyces sp. NPDC088923 TaxID=3365913 RepID=UPI0037F95568